MFNTLKPALYRNFAIILVCPVIAGFLLAIMQACTLSASRDYPVPVRLYLNEALPSGSRALSYDPAPALDQLSIRISGSGPGTAILEAQEKSITEWQESADLLLVPGAWLLQGQAFDAAGRLYLSGSLALQVDPASGAAAVLSLAPVAGNGSLRISYAPATDIAETAEWQLSLSDPQGNSILTWTDPLTVPERKLPVLAAGYYLLHSAIVDAGLLIIASTDLVRILAEYQTEAVLSAQAEAAVAGLSLRLLAGYSSSAVIRQVSRTCVRGIPFRVQLAEPAEGSEILWYLRGSLVGRNPQLVLDTSDLPQNARLDLLLFTSNAIPGATAAYSSAAAAAFSFSILNRPIRHGYARYTTLSSLDAAPVQALAQSAAMAAAPDGSRLAILSDSSTSQLSIMDLDELSTEPTLVSDSTVHVNGSNKKADVLAMSSDGQNIALANSSSGWLQMLSLADAATPSEQNSFSSADPGLDGMSYIRGLCFSPDGRYLYVLANSSRSIFGFFHENGSWSPASVFTLDDQPCGSLSTLRDLALSDDGSILALAAAGSDKLVLLDVSDGLLSWRGQAARTLGFPQLDYPLSLAFAVNSSVLAVLCADTQALLLLDCSQPGTPVQTALVSAADEPALDSASELLFLHSGDVLAVATGNGLALLAYDAINKTAASAELFVESDAATAPAISCLAESGTWLLAGQPGLKQGLLYGRIMPPELPPP